MPWTSPNLVNMTKPHGSPCCMRERLRIKITIRFSISRGVWQRSVVVATQTKTWAGGGGGARHGSTQLLTCSPGDVPCLWRTVSTSQVFRWREIKSVSESKGQVCCVPGLHPKWKADHLWQFGNDLENFGPRRQGLITTTLSLCLPLALTLIGWPSFTVSKSTLYRVSFEWGERERWCFSEARVCRLEEE